MNIESNQIDSLSIHAIECDGLTRIIRHDDTFTISLEKEHVLDAPGDYTKLQMYVSVKAPLNVGDWYTRFGSDNIYRVDSSTKKSINLKDALKIICTTDCLLVSDDEYEVFLDANQYEHTENHIPKMSRKLVKAFANHINSSKEKVSHVKLKPYIEEWL